MSAKLSEILSDVGRPVAYYPRLAKVLGGVKQAILFCQFFYWRERGADVDGWIYKSVEELEEETGLVYEEQRTARRKLVQIGLIEEYHNRVEHRVYFRINIDAMDGLWDRQLEKVHVAVGESPCGISRKSNCHMEKVDMAVGESPFRNKEHRLHIDYTETTTEKRARLDDDSKIENIESPLAQAIKTICKKGIVLGHRDGEAMKHTLYALSKENATIEQVAEFGRKCSQHWCGRDKVSLKPGPPAISNVLSCWHAVLALDEPAAKFDHSELEDLRAMGRNAPSNFN